MTTELVKVDPKEYGLEDIQVATIEQAFLPKIAERDGYAVIYEQLITKELTKELCGEARELRLKLVKTRTGIADIHKTQKSYFLAAGKFVDAWKNKETAPVEQMEEKLSEIEKYFENIEKERIAKLETDWIELTRQYTEYPASNLGLMADIVFDSYLVGLKVAYDAKIKSEQEAEAERLRLEEIDKLHTTRKEIAMPFYAFWSDFEKMLNFGEQSESDFNNFIDRIKKAKLDSDAEQEKIRLENERLKAEAIEKEKEIEAERKRQVDLLAKQKDEAEKKEAEKKERTVKRTRELSTYIVFIRDYASLIEMDEAEYQKELLEIKKGAELQWEFDRKELARKQQEQEKAEAERKRLEDELKAKQEAERKAKEEADKKEAELLAVEQEAAKAPDKEKLVKMVDSISISIPELSDATSIAVSNAINAKFEAFKVWAKSQIESI